MKKCFIAILLIFTCCMFFGCGVSLPQSNEFILLSIINDADGRVVQSINFSVGSKKLVDSGVSEEDKAEFIKNLTENITYFRDEFYLSFMLVSNANPNSEFQIGKQLIISKPVYNDYSDSIGFNMVFSSLQAWNYFHNNSVSSQGGGNIEMGYIIKSTSKGLFPFSTQITLGNGEIKSVGQRYIESFKTALEKSNIDIDYSPDLVYDYGTYSSKLKSDSDYHFEEQGIYHHTWIRKVDSYMTDNSITLYTVNANKGLWYITILAATLSGLLIAILIIKINEKRRT